MTRFFIKIEDAAGFVIDSAFKAEGGLRIHSHMKACKITDLIAVIADAIGTTDYAIKDIGMRPGEKIHEDLVHEFERTMALSSANAPQFTRIELKAMIEPLVIKHCKRSI